MIFNPEEEKELKKLSGKHPVVKRMLNELNDIQEDGIKCFYVSLNQKLIAISKQIDDAEIDISKSDDRTFDRVLKTMVDGGKIAENLRNLKKELSPEEVDQSKKKKAAKVEGVAMQ